MGMATIAYSANALRCEPLLVLAPGVKWAVL
jgi:hypothetical protein